MNTTQHKPFKEMDILEQAEYAYKKYYQGVAQKEISIEMGVSVPQISNLVTLATLPVAMKKRIKKGEVAATLILEVLRNNKGMPAEEACELIEKTIEMYGGDHKITRVDVNKFINKYNSVSIFKKILTQYNINSVKKNKEEFEMLRGLILGKLDRNMILKRYGITR